MHRNGNRIRNAVNDHGNLRGHAGLESWILLIKRDLEIKISGYGPACGEIHGGDGADLFELAAKLPLRNRIQLNGRVLVRCKTATLRFVYARRDPQSRNIG